MNMRKKVQAIIMMGIITTLVPQKINGCSLVIFGMALVASLIIGGVAGGGYSIYKHHKPKSNKQLIESTQELIDHLSSKYQASLNISENSKQHATASNQQFLKNFNQETLTKKEYMKILRKDIEELQRASQLINGHKDQIEREMKKNKYKHLARYEEIKKLADKTNDMFNKLKKLQAHVKKTLE